MGLIPKINLFLERKVGLRSYPLKVSVLFALLILGSMFLAFTVDVIHSLKEIRDEVSKASLRAAKFRTTAIRNSIMNIFQADVSLAKLYEDKGVEALTPFLGVYITCAYGEGLSLGSVKAPVLKQALKDSEGKSFYFFLVPKEWTAISVVKVAGRTYAFCHKVPYLETILSKRLGAISKYGAEFYLGKKPKVSEDDVIISYENNFSNANMYVVVPFDNLIRTLVVDRVSLYMRLYLTFLIFLSASYLVWSRLINYPIRRLKEAVKKLEGGDHNLDLKDMVQAQDEFGSTARLLKSFSEDVKRRMEKLELIMETALYTAESPEDLPEFVRKTLSNMKEIFSVSRYLFILEDSLTGKDLIRISSEEEVRDLEELFISKRKDFMESFPEPKCFSDGRECRSAILFTVNDQLGGGLVLEFEEKPDRVDEGYLKVISQHIVGTIRLSYLASTDSLTGIPNRRMLDYDIERYGRIARRYKKPFSLLMIDIDNFKHINDTYGHRIGDEVLRKVARIIKGGLRESDGVYRYGGEEFAVLCPETDKPGAFELAERIRESIKRESFWVGGDKEIYITVSVGVANYPEDTEDIGELLAVADISLYRAKREGKDRTALLAGSADREIFRERFRKGINLLSSVQEGAYTHELQPIYDLNREAIFGYELLFRVLKGKEIISMGEFLDQLEDVGLVEEIDFRTVECLKELLTREDFSDLCFFINISPRTLERGKILPALDSIPKHLRPRVFIEITERENFSTMDGARDILEQVKGMRYKIVIDDFGSGFSTLSYMKHFIKFIDLIKIDGSFIRNVKRDPYNRAILESLKIMGEKFAIDLVAEHIENREDYKVIKRLGIRFGQGFFFKRRIIRATA